MSNTEQIKALIEVRDQLTGEAADLVQLEIDALFAPFDAAVEASHLAAIEKNFQHLALLTHEKSRLSPGHRPPSERQR